MSDTATRRLCGHNHTKIGAGKCQTLAKMQKRTYPFETPIFDSMIASDLALEELRHKLSVSPNCDHYLHEPGFGLKLN